MKIISCDQSTSHCAMTLFDEKGPIDKQIIKTGSSFSKTKNKNTEYFDVVIYQIEFICKGIAEYVNKYNVDYFIYEYPAQGAMGDAKATLLTLFRSIREYLIKHTHLDIEHIRHYTPTEAKKYARNFLPRGKQGKWFYKYNKKDNTLSEVLTKPVKMEKSHMVEACERTAPVGWLTGITLSNGKSDYADSFWIGHMFVNGVKSRCGK